MRKVKTRPKLHRDNPDNSPLVGNTKVTRQDWLNAAMDVLISDGVDQVKVMNLSDRLGVSRSSFYWYFKSRKDLLDALLRHWRMFNTAALVQQAELPEPTITASVCNVFRCVVDPSLFDNRLDFAIRDWARKDGSVRRVLDQSDGLRLDALFQMFIRHGYNAVEATSRARILYFMQVGYNDADLHEPMVERLRLLPTYLLGFTGVQPLQIEVDTFRDFVAGLDSR